MVHLIAERPRMSRALPRHNPHGSRRVGSIRLFGGCLFEKTLLRLSRRPGGRHCGAPTIGRHARRFFLLSASTLSGPDPRDATYRNTKQYKTASSPWLMSVLKRMGP